MYTLSGKKMETLHRMEATRPPLLSPGMHHRLPLDRRAAPRLRLLVQRAAVVLQPALSGRVAGGPSARLFFQDRRPAPVRTTMPMGLMMLARGVISDPQLRDAIDLQHSSGERIGACLQHLGFISDEDIASVVATQWGCPVFPAESVQPGCSMLVPLSLIERYRMLPVHLVSQGKPPLRRLLRQGQPHRAALPSSTCSAATPRPASFAEPKLLQGSSYRKHDTAGEVAVAVPAPPQKPPA